MLIATAIIPSLVQVSVSQNHRSHAAINLKCNTCQNLAKIIKTSSSIRKFNCGFLDVIGFSLSLANQRLVSLEENLKEAKKLIKASPLMGLYAKLNILVDYHSATLISHWKQRWKPLRE